MRKVRVFNPKKRKKQRLFFDKDIYKYLYAHHSDLKRTKLQYLEDNVLLSDEELFKKTKHIIYSCGFQRHSYDNAWQDQACYDEWEFREKSSEYERALKEVIDELHESVVVMYCNC